MSYDKERDMNAQKQIADHIAAQPERKRRDMQQESGAGTGDLSPRHHRNEHDRQVNGQDAECPTQQGFGMSSFVNVGMIARAPVHAAEY